MNAFHFAPWDSIKVGLSSPNCLKKKFMPGSVNANAARLGQSRSQGTRAISSKIFPFREPDKQRSRTGGIAGAAATLGIVW